MADNIMTPEQHMAAHGQSQTKRDEWETAQLTVSPLTRVKIKSDACELMAAITNALHAEHGSCLDVMDDQCETIWATIAVFMASRAPK